MRFGDSSTFLYQSGFGALSGPLSGSILEVFLEPPEQLWAPGGVLGAPGAVLKAYKRRLGRSLGRHRAVLGSLEAMLEQSGGQKAPKMEPKRVPNRAPEATRADHDETLILTTVRRISICFFRVSGLLFVLNMGPEWVPNRIIDTEGVRKPLDRLLDGSWRYLGALLEALGVLLERLK